MKQPEAVFFKGTLRKIIFLINEHIKHLQQRNGEAAGAEQVVEVKSMKHFKSIM